MSSVRVDRGGPSTRQAVVSFKRPTLGRLQLEHEHRAEGEQEGLQVKYAVRQAPPCGEPADRGVEYTLMRCHPGLHII